MYGNTYVYINTYNAELFLYITMEAKGFFQFKIIINVLVSSFHYIRIPGTYVIGLRPL